MKQQTPAVDKPSTQPRKSELNEVAMLGNLDNPKTLRNVPNASEPTWNRCYTGGKMTEQEPLPGGLSQLESTGEEGACSRSKISACTALASIIQNTISKDVEPLRVAGTTVSNSVGTPTQAVVNQYQPLYQQVAQESQTRIEGITLSKPNVIKNELSDIEDEIHYLETAVVCLCSGTQRYML